MRYDSGRVVETTALSGVTRGTLLVDRQEHSIAITVEPDCEDPLGVTRGLTLDPLLLTAATEVGGLTGVQGMFQRLTVHPRKHEHLTGFVILSDSRNEAIVVKPGSTHQLTLL